MRPLAVVAVALTVAAPAAASHQSPEAAAAAARVDGRVFQTAANLRTHVLRGGRDWERFLDNRRRVVSAYHLRPVIWRGETYYSVRGLTRALRTRGIRVAPWARAHPAARARLRRNAAARLPGRAGAPVPMPPGAPSPPGVTPPPPSPPAPPGRRPLTLGFALENAEFDTAVNVDRALAEAVAAGAKWVRFDVKWFHVQPTSSALYSWSAYDSLVDLARARGLRVLATLAYSPAWARPVGTSNKFGPDTAERREAFARFAAAAATRYRDRVSAWEIWNEPNNTMFWEPKADSLAYARLLQATYGAIKAAAPAATVIAGATAPAPSLDGHLDEVEFIQGVYASGGRGHFDAWSHHPYDFNLPPGTAHKDSAWWQTYGATPSIRAVMTVNGDTDKQVWATEYGLPSSGYGELDETVQATWLQSAFTQWRTFDWGGPVFNYMVRDGAAPGIAAYWYHAGVVRSDWSRKPVFTVLQQATAP